MADHTLERILSLDPPRPMPWENYSSMFDPGDIPDLAAILTSTELVWAETDTPESWAPVHAWRALSDLKAEQAIRPLLSLLQEAADDDWVLTELPEVFARIGKAALPALEAFATDHANELFARTTITEAMARIAQRDSESRGETVTRLLRVLEPFTTNDPLLNAMVIGDLVDLGALEAAGAIKAAYDAGRVDLRHLGDWEDVQIELGLLSSRLTPANRPSWFGEASGRLAPVRAGVRDSTVSKPSPAVKAKAKRKQVRESRRRNRRKR